MVVSCLDQYQAGYFSCTMVEMEGKMLLSARLRAAFCHRSTTTGRLVLLIIINVIQVSFNFSFGEN